jgi:hypothetical protein
MLNKSKCSSYANIRGTLNNGQNYNLISLVKLIDNHPSLEFISVHKLFESLYNPQSKVQTEIMRARLVALKATLSILDDILIVLLSTK